MSEKLKPCPFCGARPHKGHTKKQVGQDGSPLQRFEIWCPQLHSKINGINEKQAFAEWNRRAPEPSPAVTGSQLEQVIRDCMAGAKYAGETDIYALLQEVMDTALRRSVKVVTGRPFYPKTDGEQS